MVAIFEDSSSGARGVWILPWPAAKMTDPSSDIRKLSGRKPRSMTSFWTGVWPRDRRVSFSSAQPAMYSQRPSAETSSPFGAVSSLPGTRAQPESVCHSPHVSRAWARRGESTVGQRDHAVEPERIGSDGTPNPRQRRSHPRVDLEHFDRLSVPMVHNVQGMHRILPRLQVKSVRVERISLVGINRTRRIRRGIEPFAASRAGKERRGRLVADADEVNATAGSISRRYDPLRTRHDRQVFGTDEIADEPNFPDGVRLQIGDNSGALAISRDRFFHIATPFIKEIRGQRRT